jgi:hypothetical protein
LERLAARYGIEHSASRATLIASLAMFISDGDEGFAQKASALEADGAAANFSAFVEAFGRAGAVHCTILCYSSQR